MFISAANRLFLLFLSTNVSLLLVVDSRQVVEPGCTKREPHAVQRKAKAVQQDSGPPQAAVDGVVAIFPADHFGIDRLHVFLRHNVGDAVHTVDSCSRD